MKKKKRKVLWGVLLAAAMIVCIVAVAYIVIYFFSGNDSAEYITETTVSDLSEASLAENHGIDWDSLTETNDDVYAWIYIPNTNIDYAVVQPSEVEGDDYYLSKNLSGNYEFAGTIYSEIQNAKDFSDPVTVLYGHNMKNGTMFATLHNFEDEKFFKKNKHIYIYMPNHKLTYKVYSAYVYDDRHILNSFNFSDEEIFTDYLEYTKDPDSMTKNTRRADLDSQSRILTLSTCTSGASNTRYLVQGVLIKDEQTD